ncbi:MAG: hypothetical protein AMXMBFR56_77620 [Polyangiaceae bacterium]
MQPATLAPVAAYQPLLELGSGGMGAAYLARATGVEGFERLVVVKRLHSHLVAVPQALERFLDEARLAAHVRHANVVGTQQVGRDERGPYLVLDYVEGASLDHLVDRLALRGRRCPVPIALRIALDALAGLRAVHEATDARGRELRMLHRDVTLQNVLLGLDGVARIADFGIAKSSLGSVVTDERYLVGKLLYMPPEYLRRGSLDGRLDVYALGVTLWLLLTGRELWDGASEEQLVAHVLHDPLPTLSDAGLEVAPQVEALLARATAKRPDERFASAGEMAAEIDRIAKDTGWLASHAEVGELLEELCGSEIAERRARVAELIGREAPAAPADEAPAARRSRLWLVAAFAAVGLLAALAFAWLPAGAPATEAALVGASAQRAAVRPVVEPPPVPSTAAPLAAESVAPAQPSAAPPARRHVAPAASPSVSPPRPPDGISKSNPYLR